jgi:hypothetical protein
LTGHAACIVNEINYKKIIYLGDLGVDGRKILKYILERFVVKAWIGLNWLRIESNGWIL